MGQASFDLLAGFDHSHRFNSKLDQTFIINPGSGEDFDYGARSTSEIGKKAWRFGVNYNQPIIENVKLKLGLRVMNAGFRSREFNDQFTQLEQDGIDGWFVEPPLTDIYQKTYNFYYIELPVGLRYEIEYRRWKPYAELGIGPAILIGSGTKEVTNVRIDRSKLDNLQNIQLFGFLSCGLEFEVNDLKSVFFQPIFRYHTTTIQNDGEYEDHLYSIGVEMGLRTILQ